MSDAKLRLRATIEANKISRLSRQLQDQQIKQLEKHFQETKNTKSGMILEILKEKQEQANIVLENLVHGGEI
jgi:hypothetical protein